jgi:hypothetical protein
MNEGSRSWFRLLLCLVMTFMPRALNPFGERPLTPHATIDVRRGSVAAEVRSIRGGITQMVRSDALYKTEAMHIRDTWHPPLCVEAA